jgi:hypothetical protein
MVDFSAMVGKCTNHRVGKSIALYECGALDGGEQRAFLDHLIECEYCYDRVYALEPLMTAFRKHREAARSIRVAELPGLGGKRPATRASRTWRLPVLVGSSVLATASLALLIFMRSAGTGTGTLEEQSAPPVIASGNSSAWQELWIPKAAYAPPRTGVTLRAPMKGFDRAMVAYRADDFPAAIEQLEALSGVEPAVSLDVDFYLGVSLLKVGRSREAISPLRRVAESSSGARHEAGRYYLALAYLKENQPRQAITELDAVIGANGEHLPNATKLRKQVIESLE